MDRMNTNAECRIPNAEIVAAKKHKRIGDCLALFAFFCSFLRQRPLKIVM